MTDEKKNINIEGNVSGGNVNIGGTQTFYGSVYFVQGDMVNLAEAGKIPFMAPNLPDNFVPREKIFAETAGNAMNAAGQVIALKGAGGFGKTTLAAAVAHDKAVQEAYPDGVLWVTLGEHPDVLRSLTALYGALTGARPSFTTIEDGAVAVAEGLKDKKYLYVIDDVWNSGHLHPFLRGGEGCARLITTRLGEVTRGAEAFTVAVDEMSRDEAIKLLTWRVQADDVQPFHALSKRLGDWALLLALGNGLLTKRIEQGDNVPGALDYVNRLLNKKGVTGLDVRKAIERNKAVSLTLDVSLDELEPDEREQFTELGIFAEDAQIPFTTLAVLWDLDEFDTEDRVQLYLDYSLVKVNFEQQTIQIHDVLREYLTEHLNDPAAVHARLIENYGDLAALPDEYAWRFIGYHLSASGRETVLRDLLLNIDFLQAKLNHTDVSALLNDCDHLPDDAAVRLIKSALNMTAHILMPDPAQLPSQLYGRLLSHREGQSYIDALLTVIAEHETLPAFLARVPSMQQAGGKLSRIFVGHSSNVTSVAFSTNGETALSASHDETIRLWDVRTGRPLHVFSEPESGWMNLVMFSPDGSMALAKSGNNIVYVYALNTGKLLHSLNVQQWDSMTFSPDGHYVLSGANDNNLRIWKLNTGDTSRVFRGHEDEVTAVAYSPDGQQVLSGSWDNTLRLWDVTTGKTRHVFQGHEEMISAAAFSPGGQMALSGSWDNTVRLWDVMTGKAKHVMQGHEGQVRMATFSPDGKTVLSASGDNVLRLWDVKNGNLLQVLEGHSDIVSSVFFAPDGKSIISASFDKTIRLWDVDTGNMLSILQGHGGYVTSVDISNDGRFVISGSIDSTLRLWEISGCTEDRSETDPQSSNNSHSDAVTRVAFVPNGQTLVTASKDSTIRIWDASSGKALHTLSGHTKPIEALAISPDGQMVASGSGDWTMRLWSIPSGRLIKAFEHSKRDIDSIAFAPHSDTVASRSGDLSGSDIVLWQVETGKQLYTWERTSGETLRASHETLRASHETLRNEHGIDFESTDGVQYFEIETINHNIELYKNTFHFSFSIDTKIEPRQIDVSVLLYVAIGDSNGMVHILQPNPALRHLMEQAADQ